MNLLLTLSFLINFCLIDKTLTFNLSPKPVQNFVEPNLKFYPPKYESSYFGYQINLRETYVIVSAPRGQTTLWSHSKFNESGSLYKCNLKSGDCAMWNVDTSTGEQPVDGYTHIKTKQWFGAAMDGDSSDNDLFTVCTPNIISVKIRYNELEYFAHGKCYLIENFGHEKIKEFYPLANKGHQSLEILINNQWIPFTHFYYGQMGSSVQMLKAPNEYIILLGAPGMLTGCGGVVRWRSHTTKKAMNLINAFDQLDVTFSSNCASNSYFGYAVAIGNFMSKTRISYAASAPRAGFVRIFTFEERFQMLENYNRPMSLAQKILGEQLGEYFGYALLADDFNNDKFTDLAIGAPMFSKKGLHENGKVYMYNCKQLQCKKGDSLLSNYEESGRFGMTFGKIGDINRDGYNDLAVGAPYEGNGKVYIFLGGRNGLATLPSQVISAPENTKTFGLGLSKGVDIDSNHHNDIVIGAPESDTVYIYKSYPVVQISAKIEPITDKVSMTDRETKFTVCTWYSTPVTSFKQNITIGLTINLDPQLKRATFSGTENRSSVVDLVISKVRYQNCKTYQIHLTHNAVVQLPIVLEAQYELKKDFRLSNEFCNDCVAVNPIDSKAVQARIAIRSGCSDDQWCMADLSIERKLTGENLTHILGKPELITIKYEIKNVGETAYFPKISIRLSPPTPFAKISPNCYVNETILHCYLLNSIPLFANAETNFLFTFDPVDLTGEKLQIRAEVSTSSNETNYDNNVLTTAIDLIESSVIEIIGKSYPAQISIFDEENIVTELNITHEFVIINYGYSTMKEINFITHIPQIYQMQYNLVDHIAMTTDREELDFEDDSNTNSDDEEPDSHRPKRETLRNVIAEARENSNVHIPHHRARYFNCSPAFNIHGCNTTTLQLHNFVAKEKIKVVLNMTLNLEHFKKIVNKAHNMLLFEVIPSIQKINDSRMETYQVSVMNTLTAIELIAEGKTPLIWIIVSIIVGILLLCGLIYWFHRMGFFRRKLKKEIEKVKRETMRLRQSMVVRDSIQFQEIEDDEKAKGE